MSTATKPRHKRLIHYDTETGKMLSSSIVYEEIVNTAPGFRVLTKEEDSRTMAWPERFRYDLPEVTELLKCDLVVSSTQFDADGEHQVSVCIRGVADENEIVKVAINDHEIDLPVNDMVLIKTDTPGIYVVKLVDHRYYAETPSYVITAIASGGSSGV